MKSLRASTHSDVGEFSAPYLIFLLLPELEVHVQKTSRY